MPWLQMPYQGQKRIWESTDSMRLVNWLINQLIQTFVPHYNMRLGLFKWSLAITELSQSWLHDGCKITYCGPFWDVHAFNQIIMSTKWWTYVFTYVGSHITTYWPNKCQHDVKHIVERHVIDIWCVACLWPSHMNMHGINLVVFNLTSNTHQACN